MVDRHGPVLKRDGVCPSCGERLPLSTRTKADNSDPRVSITCPRCGCVTTWPVYRQA